MPGSQTTDGTTLNPGASGDTVSDEDFTSKVRLSGFVPQLGATNASYKVERTKLALGEYGDDRGDPSVEGHQLPVQTVMERRLLESELLNQVDMKALAIVTRSSERHSGGLMMQRTGRELGRQ